MSMSPAESAAWGSALGSIAGAITGAAGGSTAQIGAFSGAATNIFGAIAASTIKTNQPQSQGTPVAYGPPAGDLGKPPAGTPMGMGGMVKAALIGAGVLVVGVLAWVITRRWR